MDSNTDRVAHEYLSTSQPLKLPVEDELVFFLRFYSQSLAALLQSIGAVKGLKLDLVCVLFLMIAHKLVFPLDPHFLAIK
jgi:hypothetical protein